MKLRARFTIVFFSIIIISLFFLGMVVYKNAERIITITTMNNLKTIAILTEARAMDSYDRYLDHLRISIHRVALLQALGAYQADHSSESRKKVEDALKKFTPVDSGWEDTFIFDVDGNVIAGTEGDWNGRNAKNESFFQQGSKGEFFDFVKRDPADKYAGQLILSAPMVFGSDQAGVILVVLKKDILAQITKTDLYIGATEDILIGRRNANGDGEFVAPRRFENDTKALQLVPKQRTDIPMTRALAGEEGLFDKAVDYRGHQVLAATRFIDPLKLGLVVKVDRAEFLKPIAELNKVTIAFGAVILLFTLFIAFIIARSLSTPIESLSQAAKKISAGDFAFKFYSTDTKEDDEVNVLTRAVEEMANKLILSNKDLERDISVRTQQLQSRLMELEQLNKLSVGRELRMIELKKMINELSLQLHLKPPYDLSFLQEKKENA